MYPFSAIVGQEKLKLALILNAIDLRLGGLLISGAKGTGKSLAVRAFADILPKVESVENCPFNCNPNNFAEMCLACRSKLEAEKSLHVRDRRVSIVQLPISVTEDRLIGSIDVEAALKDGRKVLEPGLLAEANQNILYIDEVNLLPDYLVNCFLDPAASGWNVVQREGLSLSHPSRFTLIASMNPEEGELRPQILDRFALHVRIESITNLKQRMEITWRSIAFEKDPIGFCKDFEKSQEELKSRIVAARELLPKVTVSDQIYDGIAKACADLEVDGLRSDIAVVKAARALAAFKGKTIVGSEDVLEVSDLVLSHRRLKGGYEETADKDTIVDRFNGALLKEDMQNKGNESMSKTQSEERVQEFLKSQTYEFRRRSVQRENQIIKIFSSLFLFAVFFMVYSAIFTLSSYVFQGFRGLPVGDVSSIISLNQLWPYLVLLSLITMFFYFLLNSLGDDKKKTLPVYLYRAYDGKLERNLVQQIRPQWGVKDEEDTQPSSSKVINIPLYASLTRLYKMILGKGPRLAESLKELREGQKKYKFSLAQRLIRKKGGSVGRRVKTITSLRYGRYVCYRFPQRKPWDIALVPTLRAAAPFQSQRKNRKLSITIEHQDIRVKMREARTPLTILLLLDMSESMSAALNTIRDVVLSIHDIAYKKRDRVSMVIFKGSGAIVLQPPTTNVNLLQKKLLNVGTSDLTPLAAGMFQAWRVLRNEKVRNQETIPILMIISDGITNIPLVKPITPSTRNEFLNSAQADVIDMAGLLHREGIRTIVINPVHEEDTQKFKGIIAENITKRWLDPTSLLLEIPRISGGYYYGIGEGGEIEISVLMDAFTIVDRERRLDKT